MRQPIPCPGDTRDREGFLWFPKIMFTDRFRVTREERWWEKARWRETFVDLFGWHTDYWLPDEADSRVE